MKQFKLILLVFILVCKWNTFLSKTLESQGEEFLESVFSVSVSKEVENTKEANKCRMPYTIATKFSCDLCCTKRCKHDARYRRICA